MNKIKQVVAVTHLEGLEVDLVDFQGLKGSMTNFDNKEELEALHLVTYLMNLKSSLEDKEAADKEEAPKELRPEVRILFFKLKSTSWMQSMALKSRYRLEGLIYVELAKVANLNQAQVSLNVEHVEAPVSNL